MICFRQLKGYCTIPGDITSVISPRTHWSRFSIFYHIKASSKHMSVINWDVISLIRLVVYDSVTAFSFCAFS